MTTIFETTDDNVNGKSDGKKIGKSIGESNISKILKEMERRICSYNYANFISKFNFMN